MNWIKLYSNTPHIRKICIIAKTVFKANSLPLNICPAYSVGYDTLFMYTKYLKEKKYGKLIYKAEDQMLDYTNIKELLSDWVGLK